MYRVVKRDNSVAEFDIKKISEAIIKAFEATEKQYNNSVIDLLALKVTADFEPKIKDGLIAVEDIQDSVEEVLNVPNRLTDKPLQLTVVDAAGAQHTVYMRRHYNAQQPHISEDFVKLEQAYLDCGAARNTKFGDAACILCDAEGLFRVTRHVLAPNPEAFVTESVIPAERWQALCTGKT